MYFESVQFRDKFGREVLLRKAEADVNESIIIQALDGKLAALIYPDFELAFANGMTEKGVEELMEANRVELNKQIAAYEQIARVKIYHEEFEKTPKKSIKRFLYQEAR